MKDIARAAGVNHGLVHHYFGSKEQLYVELLRSYDQVERRRLEQPLCAEEIVELTSEKFFNDSRIMIEIHAMAHVMPELAREMNELLQHRIRMLRELYGADSISAHLTIAAFAGMALLSDTLKELPLRDMVRQFLRWSQIAQKSGPGEAAARRESQLAGAGRSAERSLPAARKRTTRGRRHAAR